PEQEVVFGPVHTAYLRAVSITGEHAIGVELVTQLAGPGPPRLMLMTFAPLSAALRMPVATTSSVPPVSWAAPNSTSHVLDSTFTGINLTLNATPATPMPSYAC